MSQPNGTRRAATSSATVMPKPAPNVEVGVSQYAPFVIAYANEWELLRSEEVTVRQLVTMRKTDGQARALYRLLTLPIRAALKTASFVPETGVEGGSAEAAFIESMFTLPASGGGMLTPFNRVIAQLLMALFDGFAGFEMVYWSPDTGPLAGMWTLKKIAWRPPESLFFLTDDNGDFAGFRQRTMFHGRYVDVKIPVEAALYYAAQEEEKPFYGRSYFENAFWHWDKKFKLYTIAHLAAQRAAVGTRVGKLPKNPNRDEKTAFQKALADLGVAQWMTVPEDYSVDNLREGNGFNFLDLINHHNSQMSKSILASFFDNVQGGDTALVDFGRQSDSLFFLMIQTIMAEIEEVINTKVIPRFVDWNFGSGRYPQFRFGTLSDEAKGALLDTFKILAVAGPALTCRPEVLHAMEKQVSEEFGLEIDWTAIEAEMAAEKAASDAAAAAGSGGAPPVVNPAVVPTGFRLAAVDLRAAQAAQPSDQPPAAIQPPAAGQPAATRSAAGPAGASGGSPR